MLVCQTGFTVLSYNGVGILLFSY